MGSYADEYVPPHPARSLSFATPQVGQGSQSLKKNPSTTISGEKRNPAVAKSSQQKKKVKIGDDDDKANIQDGTYDHYIDFFPITDKATDKTDKRMSGLDDNIGDDIGKGMRLAHRKAFMEKAFPVVPNQVHCNAQVQSASMKSCRPKSKVDYIIHVLNHWEKGTVVKEMDPGPEKDRLVNFRCEHYAGYKYIHQYFTEEICVPGKFEPRNILRKYDKKDGTSGRIVVSREELFDSIDDWHTKNGHLDQESTWKYCRNKYANITQDHVKIYCTTCFVCMKKNPVTKNEKGSQKPIFSKKWRDRFQVDLVDFRKLRKRDPFGVLMRWMMSLKDKATRLTYICALPRKRPKLVAYKLQEIFGLIGYPKIFHIDNGKEFTSKLILEFLRLLNPNILAVTGRPRQPRDQGSVENVNALVKRVLGSVLAEQRQSGENPNWTEVLGSVASVINSQCGRGKNDVTPYEAVFGQIFDHPFSCNKAEARRCCTVDD